MALHQYMYVKVESKSDVFQATAYLRMHNSLQVLSDGGVNSFDYTYGKGTD